MANKLYKTEISAAPSVNEVASLEVVPNADEGKGFRIEKAWISAPDLDAIAAADTIQFQISTKSQSDNAALYDIDSEYEVYTAAFDFHLAEAAITGLQDPNKVIELPDIAGTILKSGKKYFLNSLITGQDGAIPMKVKFLANYINKGVVDDWHNNNLN